MNVLASDFRKCAQFMRAHGWKCGVGPNARGGGCLVWTIRAAVAPNLGIRLDYWADEVIKVLRVRTGDEYVSLPYWSDSLNPATAAETVAQLFIETAEAIERREAKKPDWNALAMAIAESHGGLGRPIWEIGRDRVNYIRSRIAVLIERYSARDTYE